LNFARWFAAEVHPHEPALRGYLWGSCPAVRDVDDVVQESFLRIRRVNHRPAVYLTARNVANTPLKTEFYNAETPQHARLRQIGRLGASCTFGVNGTF
jgi:hypothetical protein